MKNSLDLAKQIAKNNGGNVCQKPILTLIPKCCGNVKTNIVGILLWLLLKMGNGVQNVLVLKLQILID